MDIFTFVLHHSTWISPKALGFMNNSSQRKDFTGLHENFSPLWRKDFKGLQASLLPPSHSSSTFWNSFSEFFKGSSLTEGCFFCQKLPIYSQTIIKRAGFDTGSTIYQLHPLQFSCSVVSDSLWPHGLQHARPPCPSPTPRAYSNLCSLSQWCHPTISSSVVPFSSRLQSFPASGSFQMSQFFTPGSQSTGVSASASILPMNIQDWFPLGLTGWISLQSKGLSRVFSNTTVQKHQFFGAQLSL